MGRRATTHAAEAWRLLLEILLAERVRLPAIAADLALSPMQCHVLRLLEPGKPVQMRHLADCLGCDASNVTGIVDRLEARGLLERRAAAHDRRVRVLAVTRRGATLRTRVLTRLAEPPAAIASLTPIEQRRLCTILRKAIRPTPAD